jgi:hypothetical protein
MIPKERTLEAVNRLYNEPWSLMMGVNKWDQVSTYHRALSNPKTPLVVIDENKRTSRIVGADLLDEAHKFVNIMAEEEAKDYYDIHGWDDGLHGSS